MQVIHTENGIYTLSFAKGERVVDSLETFLRQEGIEAGHISGLGAVSEIEIGCYVPETKEYDRKTFAEDFEVLSINGNVGLKNNGEVMAHVHGTFAKRDFTVLGGHIFEMVISGAGELHLHTFSGQIIRAHDEETGLPLMCPLSPVTAEVATCDSSN